MKKLSLALLLFAVAVSGCSKDPPPSEPPPAEFFGKWQKNDDPAITIEFTKGGHLFLTTGNTTYTTTCNYSQNTKLKVSVASLNIKNWYEPDNFQYFTYEILTNGELLLSACTDDQTRTDYTDEDVIIQMVGRYQPLASPEQLKKSTPSASEQISTHLDAVRLEAAKAAISLKSLREDYELQLLRLERAGVKSPSDLKDNPQAQKLAEELTELVQQIADAEDKEAKYASLVADLESTKRRIRRHENIEQTDLSADEVADIEKTLAKANETMGEISSTALERSLTTEAVLEQALEARKQKLAKPAPKKKPDLPDPEPEPEPEPIPVTNPQE